MAATRRRELALVPWPAMRPLPLLRRPLGAPAPERVRLGGNHRSRVTMPGYHAGRLPGNAGKRFPAEILTHSEVLRILAATGGGYAGARDRALYTVLWRTGLRIAEALALVPKDLDLDRGTLTVLHGKGNKRRVVGIDAQTKDEIGRWLARRAELGVTRQQPVFCVISKPTVGKPLYASCVREQLRDCAQRAEIDKRVHPHGFRHTFAVELAREGVQINVIQRCLGHSNPAITAHYMNHLDPQEAIDAVHVRAWETTA